MAAVKSGAAGQIVDIEDDEDRQHVVISVEFRIRTGGVRFEGSNHMRGPRYGAVGGLSAALVLVAAVAPGLAADRALERAVVCCERADACRHQGLYDGR